MACRLVTVCEYQQPQRGEVTLLPHHTPALHRLLPFAPHLVPQCLHYQAARSQTLQQQRGGRLFAQQLKLAQRVDLVG